MRTYAMITMYENELSRSERRQKDSDFLRLVAPGTGGPDTILI